MGTDSALGLAVWIPICPLIAFFLIVFLGRRLPGQGAYVALAGMAAAFILMLVVDSAWLTRMATGSGEPFEVVYPWVQSGTGLPLSGISLTWGFMVDSATAVLLFVVTTVGALIFWFATGYMEGDSWYPRFFAYISLFAAAMLGVVISNSLVWFFMCWEIMGLCSYFLIGFWYNKPSAMKAAKKAFVVTRVGDVGFFIGILTLYKATSSHTLNFLEIFKPAELAHLAAIHWSLLGISFSAITAIALLIFCGSIGKSAQFPLHVWLPDAMEGPTPVSALIHAATMVAAGVFLVARMYPVFVAPITILGRTHSTPLLIVAGVGAFTALFAATMGVPHVDVKKVLAYSTISQLGYMFMSLGCFGYAAALFHLMTHAFFKALLFLGSGSVHHAVHTYDIREMGGLKKKMPVTRWTFLVGCLALAGVPPLAGFWSKDAILSQAYRANGPYYKVIFVIGLLAALLTAFYTFRAYYLMFEGQPRDAHKFEHAQESPKIMTTPLVILAVGASLIGLVGMPFGTSNLFGSLVKFDLPTMYAAERNDLTLILFAVSIAVALCGIWLAARAYLWRKGRTPEEGGLRGVGLQPAYNMAARLWLVDEIYDDAFVKSTLALSAMVGAFDNGVVDDKLVNGPAVLTVWFSRISDWFDRTVVDGIVRVVAEFAAASGEAFRRVQQGVIQVYALIVFGSVFLLILFVRYIR